MLNVAAQIEDRIRAHRPLELPVPWSDDIIYPNYGGLSILNLMNSILAHFAVPDATTPLDNAVWMGAQAFEGVQRVVLFLTDGLGYKLLTEMTSVDAGLHEVVQDITEGRGPVPLTSTAPSTTAVALPTMWTGQPPIVHGMVGTQMFLREVGTFSDMLRYSPAMGKHARDAYEDWGLHAESFVPVPGLSERLAAVGVPSHLLLERQLMGSGLSRILHRGVEKSNRHPHTGTSDVWLRLHDVLAATIGQRCFVNAYWSAVDSLSHLYGAKSRYVHHEIRLQMTMLRDVLASPQVHDGQTLVCIVADHGHHNVTDAVDFSRDPLTRDAQRMPFGGDTRFAYLHLRTPQRMIDVLSREYLDRLAWIETEAALHAGLFGSGEMNPELLFRMGDVIVVPRLGAWLVDEYRPPHHASMHSGLSEWEMLVPLLWRRV
ncbi:MAG: alkaline phosphatase family protein [Anaerolineae bacterium]